MTRAKSFISNDVCEDIVLAKVIVERFPNVQMDIDRDTGELLPELKNKGNLSDKVSLKILLDENGRSVYPQNLYLHHLISIKGLKNADTSSQSLLAFTRWLSFKGVKYDDLNANPSEGVVWKFADYLIANLRQVEHNGQVINPDGFSLSTARTYCSSVINFYKWLHYEAILPFNSSRKPFNIINGTRKFSGDSGMLYHTWKGSSYTFQTTDIIKRFPAIETTEPWKKLKPMTKDDLVIFNDALSTLNPDLQLIFSLMVETGLRVAEVATFPESIGYQGLPITKMTLSSANGVATKFEKPRDIEILEHQLNKLTIYLFSKKRKEKLKKIGVIINKLGISTSGHRRLFVNEQGNPYDSKTIQREWIKLRDSIRVEHPNWYYRLHDTRATFATYWLLSEQKKRDVTYNYLLDELAKLMGHSSTITTMKYVKFLENQSIWIKHSLDKNDRATAAQVTGVK